MGMDGCVGCTDSEQAGGRLEWTSSYRMLFHRVQYLMEWTYTPFTCGFEAILASPSIPYTPESLLQQFGTVA